MVTYDVTTLSLNVFCSKLITGIVALAKETFPSIPLNVWSTKLISLAFRLAMCMYKGEYFVLKCSKYASKIFCGNHVPIEKAGSGNPLLAHVREKAM